MSRKVYVEVTTRLVLSMNEGIEVSEVVAELDYDFTSRTAGVEVTDTDIRDYNVVDSK